MKKIITAIGNNRLAEEIKKRNIYEVVSRDIPYMEGVLEVLDEIQDIDTIIISEILDGEIDFKDLIRKILQKNEKIEIIVFVEERNAEIQNFLFSNGIYKIFENNEVDINTFINSISSNNMNVTPDYNYINGELQKIREDMLEKENGKNSFEEFNATGKVIVLSGSYNSGKSTIASILAIEYAKKGQKTLIIDFDIYNSSINTLFNIQKYKKSEIAFNIENQIIKVSKNLDALCAIDLLFNNENTVDYINLEDMIRKFKVKYDIILIDTSSDYKYKYLARILNSADGIVFLIVPSVVELKKSANLLEVFLEDFKIDKKKFQIVLNKVTSTSVDKMIIEQMFKDIVISGVTGFDEEIERKVMNKKQEDLVKINEKIGE